MAVVGGTFMTHADYIRQTKPDGTVARVVIDQLRQTNSIVQDAVYTPSDQPWSKTSIIRVGEPTTTMRGINEYVAPSKTTHEQRVEAMSIIQSWSDIDAILVDNAKSVDDGAKARMNQIRGHMVKHAKDLALHIIYSSSQTNAKAFDGLQVRYASTSSGEQAVNVISAGGTTSSAQASLYLVGWASEANPEGISLIHPPAFPMGINHKNHGTKPMPDASGNLLTKYLDEIQQVVGVSVPNWQYGGRVCNIETSHFDALTSTQAPTSFANLLHKSLELLNRMPMDAPGITWKWYAPRKIASGLMRLMVEKQSSAVSLRTSQNEAGKTIHTMNLWGLDLGIVDQMAINEAVVS